MFRGRAIILGALCGILALAGCGGGKDPVVIRVKGRTTPKSEIVFEYERLQGPGRWATASLEERGKFVDTFAKKELLAAYAHELYGDELTGRERLIFNRWRDKQTVRRFWRAIREGITVPASVIDSLKALMQEERHLQHILCQDEAPAREIYQKLRAGGDFDAVGKEYKALNPQGVTLADEGWVLRPVLDPAIGNALFALEKPGDVAEPVHSLSYGWHVVRLAGVRPTDPTRSAEEVNKLADATYRRKLMADKVQVLNEKYAIQVVDSNIAPLRIHLAAMYDSMSNASSSGIQVDYQALPPPLHRFTAEERALPLVHWSGGTLTVGDFIQTLFETDIDNWPTVGDDARLRTQIIKRMVQWAFFREASAAGTLDEPNFARDIRRKRDELFLEKLHRERLGDLGQKITDADVAKYWDEHGEEYRAKDLVGYGFLRFPADAKQLAANAYATLMQGVKWGMVGSDVGRQDPRVGYEVMLDPTDGPPYPELTALAQRYDPQPSGEPTVTEPLEVNGDWVVLRIGFRSRPGTLTLEKAAPLLRRDMERLRMEQALQAMLDQAQGRLGLKVNKRALR